MLKEIEYIPQNKCNCIWKEIKCVTPNKFSCIYKVVDPEVSMTFVVSFNSTSLANINNVDLEWYIGFNT